MNTVILGRQLQRLSYRYPVDVSRDGSVIIIREFETPPGYNYHSIDIRLELPEDYPASPPGVTPSRVYVPVGLRYQGHKPRDFHPHDSHWAWWCFESMKGWNPCRDDLITFFEILRLTMTENSMEGERSWLERLFSV